MNRSPLASIGQDPTRKPGNAGPPGLGLAESERPAFADLLHEASRGVQETRRRPPERPARHQPQERSTAGADRADGLARERQTGDAHEAGEAEGSPARNDGQPADRATSDADKQQTTEDDLTSSAVAGDQGGQPLATEPGLEGTGDAAENAVVAAGLVTTQPADEGVDGDGEVEFRLPAREVDGKADPSQSRSRVVPSTPPPTQTVYASVPPADMELGNENFGALGLLSPQDLVDMEVQGETDGGPMMARLQQALAANHAEDVDELGKPVVPQLVRSMAALARNGVSEMRLQLQPGDLGEIELRVRATEGMVRSEVMVQHAEVKNLLDSQIDRLRQALEAQGLRLEGFDVGVSDDGAFAQDREADGTAQSFGRLLDNDRDESANTDEIVGVAPRHPTQLSDDGVDWLV